MNAPPKVAPVNVTDHALIRYLERVRGIDLAIVREEIARIVGPAHVAGATSVSQNGFTYIIRDSQVTTVVPGASPSAANRRMHKGNGRSNSVTRPVRGSTS